MKKGENRERKYYFFKSTVQKQKSKFLHPVTRKSQIKKTFFTYQVFKKLLSDSWVHIIVFVVCQ